VSDDKDRRKIAPTPKRIADFRKRGEIAFSRDLTGVAALAGGALAVGATLPRTAATLRDLTSMIFSRADSISPGAAASAALKAFAVCSLPAAAGAVAGTLIAGAVQLGWPPALKPLGFDLGRIFSAGSIGQLFSPKAAAGRALKSFLRVAFVAAACTLALAGEIRRLRDLPIPDAASLGTRTAAAVGALALAAGLTLAGMAALDWILSRRALAARMRMTPEEAKREHREQEGDPQIKRRRRQRMRELAKRRLVSAVKKADVVIVNPTEYAVALRYRANEAPAPVVLAKGRGAVADRIRTLARKAGIPIIPQPPLARLIHKLVPEGRAIPASLYRAVAEVLAYVHKLRRRRSK
jgi:flagellar biosynthesis protein FlhB